MKILITGGNGFIGKKLVQLYLDNNIKVAVVDKTIDSTQHLKSVTYYQVNVLDKKNLFSVFLKESPDFVSHHAALTSINDTSNELLNTNIIGTRNVCLAAKKSQAKHLVFASSAAVYKKSNQISLENSEIEANSKYGKSKIIGEYIVKNILNNSSTSYAILRYSNVFGANQNHRNGGVISKFLHSSYLNNNVNIDGSGTQTRDFIHVRDVAQANILISKTKANGIFNVSSDSETSIAELAFIFQQKFPNLKICKTKKNYGVTKSKLSNEKIKTKLNWKTKKNLLETLPELIENYKK